MYRPNDPSDNLSWGNSTWKTKEFFCPLQQIDKLDQISHRFRGIIDKIYARYNNDHRKLGEVLGGIFIKKIPKLLLPEAKETQIYLPEFKSDPVFNNISVTVMQILAKPRFAKKYSTLAPAWSSPINLAWESKFYVDVDPSHTSRQAVQHYIALVTQMIIDHEIRQLNMERSLAFYDALTWIPNRLGFARWVIQKLADLGVSSDAINEELPKRPFSVLIFDIDDFKGVNEKFDHHGGDEALISIADTFQNFMCTSEFYRPDSRTGVSFNPIEPVYARLGGEEFIAFLPEVARENATLIANSLVNIIRNHKLQLIPKESERAIDLELRISVGVASYDPNNPPMEGINRQCSKPKKKNEIKVPPTIWALMEEANTAASRAKKLGKDRAIHYNDEVKISEDAHKAGAFREEIGNAVRWIHSMSKVLDILEQLIQKHST